MYLPPSELVALNIINKIKNKREIAPRAITENFPFSPKFKLDIIKIVINIKILKIIANLSP